MQMMFSIKISKAFAPFLVMPAACTWLLALLFALQLAHPLAAQEVDSRLFGRWVSYKFIGSPCTDTIASIEYSFFPDGKYSIDTTMKALGTRKHLRASGTFELRQETIIGHVDGHRVGPFPYRFQERDLVIHNGAPACEIYLRQMEEY